MALSIQLSTAILLSVSIAYPQLPSLAEGQFLPGTYEGKQIRLTLRETSPGRYTGTLEFDSKTYPATARSSNSQLTGQFTADGSTFPFTATFQGITLRLTSGGAEYVLTKHAESTFGTPAKSNPLGGRQPVDTPQPQSTFGATRLHKHAKGYTLRLPAGWTATDNDEGIVLLPTGVVYDPNRNDNPELFIVMMKDGYTPAAERQFVQELSGAFTQGDATVQRNGVRETMSFGARQGMVYRWDLRDNRAGRNIAFDLFGAPDGDRVYIVLAAGTAERVRTREAQVRQLLASMNFEAPRVVAGAASAVGGPLADATPLAQQWLQKLRGRMIRQFFSYSGMSSSKYHYTNADGTYIYRSSSMVSIDVSGASALSTSKGANSGRWKIRDVNGNIFLQVTYDNGETNMMRITQDSRFWYLNGDKAFAVDAQ